MAAITVRDVAGRIVRRLAPSADRRAVIWNGRDDAGRPLPGGSYFVGAHDAVRDIAARRVLLVR